MECSLVMSGRLNTIEHRQRLDFEMTMLHKGQPSLALFKMASLVRLTVSDFEMR